MLLAFAFATVGCARQIRVTQPVSMSPMTDATLSVVLRGVQVSNDVIAMGLTENSTLGVVLDITNVGTEPYTLNPASVSCWLELSPDLPGQTLSLKPAGGGLGPSPGGRRNELVMIPPGQTRAAWVRFSAYRYEGSDVPRRITISLPDARGRRVQLVIADPARPTLRWEMPPIPLSGTLGFQTTTLSGSALDARATAVQLSNVWRTGPLLWDAGVGLRLLVERQGQLMSSTSGFSGAAWHAHVTVPVVNWGSWQNPRLLGLYGGGEVQWLSAIRPAGSNERTSAGWSYGVLAAEGGIEMDFGTQLPVASPFPITPSGRPMPGWTARVGYTHWWFPGGSSGGYTFGVRLSF